MKHDIAVMRAAVLSQRYRDPRSLPAALLSTVRGILDAVAEGEASWPDKRTLFSHVRMLGFKLSQAMDVNELAAALEEATLAEGDPLEDALASFEAFARGLTAQKDVAFVRSRVARLLAEITPARDPNLLACRCCGSAPNVGATLICSRCVEQGERKAALPLPSTPDPRKIEENDA